ncbi:MAG: alpha/beta fold hydrolase [Phycisphaeraceae bacterium]|nr:MAG: alpha/beta fold hydrolase [Phycisphaeraceae bacterium]
MLKRVAVAVVLVMVVRWTSLAESVAVYHPSRELFETPRGYEDVWIDGPGGVKLHGWFLRAAGAAPGERRAAVLHAHGNAGRLPDHEGFSSYLAGAGFHVLMFDYRGYGRSSPARLLTREKLLADTLAAYDALATRDDVDAGRIGVYGVSLGGTFALHAAARRAGGGVRGGVLGMGRVEGDRGGSPADPGADVDADGARRGGRDARAGGAAAAADPRRPRFDRPAEASRGSPRRGVVGGGRGGGSAHHGRGPQRDHRGPAGGVVGDHGVYRGYAGEGFGRWGRGSLR